MTYHPAFLRYASAVAFSACICGAAYAAPEAGAVIGNQAVATYTNASGDTITVTSNTVETLVQQVAGVTLTSDNSETIAPGGKAFLPHIITNEGNGPDAFTLTATEDSSGTLNTSQLVFYPDANMDGVADSATSLSQTPVLAPGEQFGVVIEATVPATAAGAETITVQAASQLDGTVLSSNTDTLTISNDAIVELVKSMVADAASAGNPNIIDAGDTVTITLTYSSTGLTAATNYAVEDVLSTGLSYVPGSARWSDSGVALDDADGAPTPDASNGNGETIAWEFDGTQTVNFNLSSVASGRSGRVTFQATVAAGANAGLITNVATQTVNGTTFPNSNTASIVIANQYSASIADTAINADGSPDGSVTSSTDDDGAQNDSVTETADVFQGAVIRHEFIVTNHSNQADSFVVSVANTDFPADTTFRIVGADGVTPIIGSVGPLGIDASTRVTLIATLPSNLLPTTTTDYTAVVTVTSDASGVTDTSTAEFTGAILAASVDLENTLVGAEGDGAAPTNGGAPWITQAVAPGAPVTFAMIVENNGPVSDSYNLTLDQALPSGWTVEFRNANGTLISNTGTIPAGQQSAISVTVIPAKTAAPGTAPIDIKVSSAVSGQSDRIVNALSVSEIFDIHIIESQDVQASPGGVVDIFHTITNAGNVAITEGAIAHGGLSDFAGAIFWDQNENGVLDASDPVIENFDELTDGISSGVNGLALGGSISVIYRVQTPSTATAGVLEIATLSVATSLNLGAGTDADTSDNSVQDRIIIVSGDVTLNKYQYIDSACDGTVGTFSKTRQNVDPGQCIRYMIVAANTGAFDADNVRISDTAPAYTTVTNCGGLCPETLFPTSSTATVTTTSISSDHGTVLPGGVARIEFTVRVDN
ncbi:hypothetical protein BFP70_10545 [Thioclava sp. SK-1]|uniref:beta strand repeat-containing protein n=1 Tax=Thioclava sp. SK-1 TaxID=1889770 RepID=UPI000826746A|nr:NEW3 domain-containing protein [Thioclava sp. SK-1]OCX64482.1 hypothetical protein BFP70_10545 [Thioclava sp. SK-1]